MTESYDAPGTRTGRGRLGRSPVQQGTSPAQGYQPAEVNQGLADAVMGALGRMQLRLDLMAREQSEALAAMQARLLVLTEAVEALSAPDESAGPEAAEASTAAPEDALTPQHGWTDPATSPTEPTPWQPASDQPGDASDGGGFFR